MLGDMNDQHGSVKCELECSAKKKFVEVNRHASVKSEPRNRSEEKKISTQTYVRTWDAGRECGQSEASSTTPTCGRC